MKAKHVKDMNELYGAGKGAFVWTYTVSEVIEGNPRTITGIICNCPGCGVHGHMRVGETKPSESPSWQWDGNEEEPTLSPSVNCVGCCGWHGHLIAGEWKPV